ncbi:MAG: hypothetical protein B7733_00795 [Myxococcales bacterium FL481]|nr:MAG: hypothetical protein B7733_00795 [Myxococcales bacterium FL481]
MSLYRHTVAGAASIRSMRLATVMASLLLQSRPAAASPSTASPAASAPSEPRVRPARWMWKHTSALPIVFYTPENHLGLGAGLLTTWGKAAHADLRPNSVLLALMHTTLRQTIFSFATELRLGDERHLIDAELRYIDWPDRFFGIGNDPRDGDEEQFTDRYWQSHLNYRLRLWRRWFAGVGYLFRASQTPGIQEDPRLLVPEVTYGVGPRTWSGVWMGTSWDGRDTTFWPTSGSFMQIEATAFRPGLGSDFAATRYRADLRRYIELQDGWILAPRLRLDAIAGSEEQIPFQLMAQLGGSDLFRGWYLGKLRDRRLAAIELEQRVELTPRLGIVGFASIGRVAPRWPDMAQGQLRQAAGIGGRVAIKRALRANLRLDVAYGDGLHFYLQFKEAF